MSVTYYSLDDKYAIVGRVLQSERGTLIDIGARDRVLKKRLAQAIEYFSSDIGYGHDYQIDLEKNIVLPDRKFDIVIALDVLEHLENIHNAFFEISRLAERKLIIALPNFASLPRRCTYLVKGHLGTGKYDLLPTHQGDRHRWLTVYAEINHFVMENGIRAGFELTAVYEEIIRTSVLRQFAYLTLRLGIPLGGLMTDRCIYVLSRKSRNG